MITEKQGKKKATNYGIIFFEVSSKTKKGLNEAFLYMTENIYNINEEKIKTEEIEMNREIGIIEDNNQNEECCFII